MFSLYPLPSFIAPGFAWFCPVLPPFLPVRSLFTPVQVVASLLRKGHIVAVVQGRHPITATSLGTRSLLAYVDNRQFAARVRRSPYSPVPCLLRVEALQTVAEELVPAPHGPRAPRLRPEVQKRYPFLVDGHGRGRVVTVARSANPWLWEVLRIVEAAEDRGILMHSRFPHKGRELLTVHDALNGFFSDADLQYLVLENALFRKRAKKRVGLGRSAFTRAADAPPRPTKSRSSRPTGQRQPLRATVRPG